MQKSVKGTRNARKTVSEGIARRRDWMAGMFIERKACTSSPRLYACGGGGRMHKAAAHLFHNQRFWALVRSFQTGHLRGTGRDLGNWKKKIVIVIVVFL